jgi:hypothetical protein
MGSQSLTNYQKIIPGERKRIHLKVSGKLDSATLVSHSNPKRKRGNTLRQFPRLRFGLRYSRGFAAKWRCPITKGELRKDV